MEKTLMMGKTPMMGKTRMMEKTLMMGQNPKSLSDIKGHWAESFIQALFDKELISGFSDGTFKPDAKMTRAEYAALLVKAFNPTAKRNGTLHRCCQQFLGKGRNSTSLSQSIPVRLPEQCLSNLMTMYSGYKCLFRW
jgi:hypothetical protein